MGEGRVVVDLVEILSGMIVAAAVVVIVMIVVVVVRVITGMNALVIMDVAVSGLFLTIEKTLLTIIIVFLVTAIRLKLLTHLSLLPFPHTPSFFHNE